MTAASKPAQQPPVDNSYWVIVPAAGSGKRMGADKPKQYLPLLGQPLIAHTLQNILSWPGLAGIVVAIAANDRDFATLVEAANPRVHTVTGGAERADSVLAALDYLSTQAAPETSVLVHDAARPLVSVDDIRALAAADPMALLAQPASDTVKRAAQSGDKSCVTETLPREQIWLAQTPQKAPLETLRQCLQQGLKANPTAITDEASALELAGFKPQLVPACRSNFKVTHPADLVLAEALLQHRQQSGAQSGIQQ
ncbi:2-C-methyl-D-erythritol 4-phosphate cytidylyltransferase [uncultured Microbulbifer sp.]|uniref:2-C-methyl-D-erythritol 4-phosphate cytidylyltransferase n=1 Tax=uncultured Microbulbifer sp. TaxID=348147 RepID=UPI0025FE6C1D|nr:2-C-methyl-D-erythritol 4-phosphate cytidylyltransferase [uncultured Microbulbifer sp.]